MFDDPLFSVYKLNPPIINEMKLQVWAMATSCARKFHLDW